ncbi:MAG: Isoquinoline 1-oxidoreductase subunit [Pseudomonadota bacterium]
MSEEMQGNGRAAAWVAGGLAFAAVVALIFFAARSARDAQAAASFAALMPVLQSPRCMNCHRSDLPRVRDDARKHVPKVLPADDGAGAGGMRCAICHRATNNAITRIPGAPDWKMPPYEMSLDGLTAADICDNWKDPAMNGGRSVGDVVKHLEHDHLVAWSWTPGEGRAKPPLSFDAFLAHARRWVEHGAACPSD